MNLWKKICSINEKVEIIGHIKHLKCGVGEIFHLSRKYSRNTYCSKDCILAWRITLFLLGVGRETFFSVILLGTNVCLLYKVIYLIFLKNSIAMYSLLFALFVFLFVFDFFLHVIFSRLVSPPTIDKTWYAMIFWIFL